jgi:hypothetical protein
MITATMELKIKGILVLVELNFLKIPQIGREKAQVYRVSFCSSFLTQKQVLGKNLLPVRLIMLIQPQVFLQRKEA